MKAKIAMVCPEGAPPTVYIRIFRLFQIFASAIGYNSQYRVLRCCLDDRA